MQKLKPENHLSTTEENIRKILEAYSIADFTFRPISKGISNTSLVIECDGKKYVLRIYAQGRKSDGDIALEIHFQDYLRQQGIPIPSIYKNTDGKEITVLEIEGRQWRIVLMEFVDGESVTPNPTSELIAELANLQAKMHLLGMDFVEDSDETKNLWIDLHDSFAGKIKNIPNDDQEILDFIERVKAYSYPLSSELPYGFNHLDIDFDGNVLTKDNKVSGIVDFDDCEYSPFVVCLGYTLWNILDDNGVDAMRYYLKEYEKVRPLTGIERKTLPHVIFFRNYVIGVFRLLLPDENTPDISNVLKLEKQIPTLTF